MHSILYAVFIIITAMIGLKQGIEPTRIIRYILIHSLILCISVIIEKYVNKRD